jgi:hypothetical protein
MIARAGFLLGDLPSSEGEVREITHLGNYETNVQVNIR